MSVTAEKSDRHIVSGEYMSSDVEHIVALVQGDMIISTFPEDQTDAAIDLARVLCRALTQPVDLFRVRCGEAESVQAGASAHTAGPGWTHVAHLHFIFLVGVEVVMCDPDRQESVAGQHPTT